MSRSIQAAVAVAAAAATLAGAAATAHASNVGIEGNTLTLRAKPGEANHVRVERHRSGAVAISDLAPITIRGSECRRDPGSSRVLCHPALVGSVLAVLGDGDDSFRSEQEDRAVVDAGPGDDQLSVIDLRVDPIFDLSPASSQVDFTGGPGNDTARFRDVFEPRIGSPGVSVTKDGVANDGRPIDRHNIRPDVEVLQGSPQDDFLGGGPGPDTFVSSGGADLLHGLAGNDLFLMGLVKDGATRARGGGDRDTVSYAQRTRPVLVSPDDPAFRDGESGELDSIDGVEVIEGGSAADNIVSAPGSTRGYRMIGGAGDDILASGAGRDRLTGGLGQDRMSSGADRDVVEARDLARDERIDCGSGGPDEVLLDFREGPTSGCEIRRLPALPGQPGS